MSSEENVKKDDQQIRGQRGEVGTASAGDKIKQLHRSEGGNLSLKTFARKLAKSGDEIASEWLSNKAGVANQSRTDANIKKAIESRAATKSKRQAKKGK